MIPLTQFSRKNIAVLGLGKTGLSVCRALQAGGAEVFAWDDNETTRIAAAAQGIPIVSADQLNWYTLSGLVISPGIPNQHPIIKAASYNEVPLFGDLDLLQLHCPKAHYIGITGTNGKSTTTALVAHILKEAGLSSEAGGNIGVPTTSLDPPPAQGSHVYVLEVSSYQLSHARNFHANVTALLNISADHLERHGSMENYVKAKRLIFEHQSSKDTAVIGIDSTFSRNIFKELQQQKGPRLIPVSVVETLKKGIYQEKGWLVDALETSPQRLLNMRQLTRTPGMHNWQNCMVAYAICRALGLEKDRIIRAIRTFAGLPHRQELVAVHRGIRYINDSKATNGDAAARALVCYKPIHWILGGRPKETDLDIVVPYFNRITKAYTIGEATERYAEIFSGHNIPVEPCYKLETAVTAAHRDAQEMGTDNAVVLLSPACASFDQYDNYEARGNAFRLSVKEMLEEENRTARASIPGR